MSENILHIIKFSMTEQQEAKEKFILGIFCLNSYTISL